MKPTITKQAAINADHSLLPTPESISFPGCQTDLKGTAHMSEEHLSSS